MKRSRSSQAGGGRPDSGEMVARCLVKLQAGSLVHV